MWRFVIFGVEAGDIRTEVGDIRVEVGDIRVEVGHILVGASEGRADVLVGKEGEGRVLRFLSEQLLKISGHLRFLSVPRPPIKSGQCVDYRAHFFPMDTCSRGRQHSLQRENFEFGYP